MVDLEDTARSPPARARVVSIGHVEVDAPASRRALRIVARVESDGALEEDWGRQLGGIAGGVVGVGWSSTWARVRRPCLRGPGCAADRELQRASR